MGKKSYDDRTPVQRGWDILEEGNYGNNVFPQSSLLPGGKTGGIFPPVENPPTLGPMYYKHALKKQK